MNTNEHRMLHQTHQKRRFDLTYIYINGDKLTNFGALLSSSGNEERRNRVKKGGTFFEGEEAEISGKTNRKIIICKTTGLSETEQKHMRNTREDRNHNMQHEI